MADTTLLTVEHEGVSVSLLVWRFLKRQPPGFVERVYELNPGLAEFGPILPLGTRVLVPLEVAQDRPEEVVTLWD